MNISYHRRIPETQTRAVVLIILGLVVWGAQPEASHADEPHTTHVLPQSSTQIVVVLADDWTSTSAWLFLFERTNGFGSWARVASPIPVVLGGNGMAWGIGRHPEPDGGPRKVEGDLRSPAGVFALGQAFGRGPPFARLKLSYRQIRKTTECVDDPGSAHYNRLVERNQIRPDWTSSEVMMDFGSLYSLGVVVAHNPPPTRSNAGSCVFLHVWSGPGTTTLGCTAMREIDLRRVLKRLDPKNKPLLVQVPRKVYEEVAKKWGLPPSRSLQLQR